MQEIFESQDEPLLMQNWHKSKCKEMGKMEFVEQLREERQREMPGLCRALNGFKDTKHAAEAIGVGERRSTSPPSTSK